MGRRELMKEKAGTCGMGLGRTHLAAADDENFLSFDLPGEDQAASALYLGKVGSILFTHDVVFFQVGRCIEDA